MKKTTITLIGTLCCCNAFAANSNTYYDGGILSRCTSKYILVGGIASFNYQDNAWKLVVKDGWGGNNCSLSVNSNCEADIISAMGQTEYSNGSVNGVLSNASCACETNTDCVTGFKCQSVGAANRYGFCTQIANFCTTDSQCAMGKGYVCVSGKCTQKCYVDNMPDDTGWTVVTKTSDMYKFDLIEQSTSYTCKQSGSSYAWTATNYYRCAKNAYGNPTNASSGCSMCPNYPGPMTSPAGTTSVTGCYIPSGTNYGDITGSYTLKGDCHYVP
ncbi:MAG: hypothetical protein NC311_03770 [Muribaculaceae bacterium]|nr:hypothetical protein [Muribaculaceae bacterium]